MVKTRFLHFCLALLGIAAFLALAIALENKVGISVAFTSRVACASACIFLLAKVTADYPGEWWPWIGVAFAVLIDIGLFLTPIFDRPSSRGEVMIFALPDAAAMLAARTWSYPVTNAHQRAVRQQLIIGLILALAFCSIILAIGFVPNRVER